MHNIKESVFSALSSFRIPARLLILLLVSGLLHLVLAALFVYATRHQQNLQPAPHNFVMIQLGRTPAQYPAASPQQHPLSPSNQTLRELPVITPTIAKPALQTAPSVISPMQQRNPPQTSLPPSANLSLQGSSPASTGREIKSSAVQHEHEEKSAGEAIVGNTGAPAFSKQIPPVYPPLARRRGREGSVLLRLHISKTGQLTRAEVLEDPGHGFAEAALEAVHASHFSPGYLHGKPVTMKATLTIRFSLR